MAGSAVVARVPISYLDKNGSQIFVDVSQLRVENGELNGFSAPKDYSDAEGYLKSLFAAGLLEVSKNPPVAPAVQFVAVDWGSGGNNTTVTIADVPPVLPAVVVTSISVKVSRIDEYTNITVPDLLRHLGNEQEQGTRPGLVRIKKGDATSALPTTLTKQALIVSGGIGARASLDLGGGANSITLEAKGTSAEGASTTITITLGAPGRFSLTAEWTKEETMLLAKLNFKNFDYLISVNRPVGAPRPSPGTYNLVGGVDAVKAKVTASGLEP